MSHLPARFESPSHLGQGQHRLAEPIFKGPRKLIPVSACSVPRLVGAEERDGRPRFICDAKGRRLERENHFVISPVNRARFGEISKAQVEVS